MNTYIELVALHPPGDSEVVDRVALREALVALVQMVLPRESLWVRASPAYSYLAHLTALNMGREERLWTEERPDADTHERRPRVSVLMGSPEGRQGLEGRRVLDVTATRSGPFAKPLGNAEPLNGRVFAPLFYEHLYLREGEDGGPSPGEPPDLSPMGPTAPRPQTVSQPGREEAGRVGPLEPDLERSLLSWWCKKDEGAQASALLGLKRLLGQEVVAVLFHGSAAHDLLAPGGDVDIFIVTAGEPARHRLRGVWADVTVYSSMRFERCALEGDLFIWTLTRSSRIAWDLNRAAVKVLKGFRPRKDYRSERRLALQVGWLLSAKELRQCDPEPVASTLRWSVRTLLLAEALENRPRVRDLSPRTLAGLGGTLDVVSWVSLRPGDCVDARHLRTFLSWLETQGSRPEWAGRTLAEMGPHLDASIQGFYQRLKVSQASSGA